MFSSSTIKCSWIFLAGVLNLLPLWNLGTAEPCRQITLSRDNYLKGLELSSQGAWRNSGFSQTWTEHRKKWKLKYNNLIRTASEYITLTWPQLLLCLNLNLGTTLKTFHLPNKALLNYTLLYLCFFFRWGKWSEQTCWDSVVSGLGTRLLLCNLHNYCCFSKQFFNFIKN